VGGFGCALAVLAAGFALLGVLPLLGWLNWISTLPLAILAIVFSGVALSRGSRSPTATLGLAGGVFALCWGVFRLTLGGGIV
jgi:hypothetical protein